MPGLSSNLQRYEEALLLLAVSSVLLPTRLPAFGQSFTVSFPKERGNKPLDGRLLLLLSTDQSEEPRMQIDDSPRTQLVFGVNVDGLAPGVAATVDARALGYPIRSLKDVPPGEYTVQAVLNIYETFHRSDGSTVKLHMDQGEGQHWNISPGNLYSKPEKVAVASGAAPIALSLTEEIPSFPSPKDTKYVRHIRIQSDLLTKFWGRPMFLSAVILVPEGFDVIPTRISPRWFSRTTLSMGSTTSAQRRPTPT
jgi:hypothetical protein